MAYILCVSPLCPCNCNFTIRFAMQKSLKSRNKEERNNFPEMWACKTRGSECEESSKRPEESQEEGVRQGRTDAKLASTSLDYHPRPQEDSTTTQTSARNGKWLSSKKQDGRESRQRLEMMVALLRLGHNGTTEARTRPEPMQGTPRFLRSGKRDADGDEDE
ncbi:hypothetical protein PGTUg99_000359 [Puccinia graminis f. sp. tritici]|uniref:Uncharacterized protein n=1 Tax=Puccinia graminis f. sp. tritici TaxID=56615 RepID=A0A5B0P858_PUCGR|nr:hypothetical protein PGTUg99_000359 [Puccinia graminis f. sp. tritici]